MSMTLIPVIVLNWRHCCLYDLFSGRLRIVKEVVKVNRVPIKQASVAKADLPCVTTFFPLENWNIFKKIQGVSCLVLVFLN